MKEKLIQAVYDNLQGDIPKELRMPGVENLFTDDSYCTKRYADMLNAYERLCDRLGTVDEDADVEVIINALMDIERVFSRKMFEYGAKFALELLMKD